MKAKQIDLIEWINQLLLYLIAILCIFPVIHVLAVSLSSEAAVSAGLVKIWPVQFTWSSYDFVAGQTAFWRAMGVSLERIVLGGGLNFVLVIITAYPLSKEAGEFKGRTIFAWIFFLTMIFHGGLIPWYLLIKQLGLLDSIWALVLPGAVPIFNVILLLNFYRQIPRDLNDAALMDGAGHWTTLWKIYVPISLPALATITLFSLVGQWNSWFDGLILMNRPEHYPLQSYLQTIVMPQDVSQLKISDVTTKTDISDRTIKTAEIFLGALPILVVYPFLQKFFVKGVVVGSVKG